MKMMVASRSYGITTYLHWEELILAGLGCSSLSRDFPSSGRTIPMIVSVLDFAALSVLYVA